MPVRVLVVDDHRLVARGVAAMLATESDFEVVGTAGSAGEALDQAAACQPDVILMDYRLPDGNGIVASRPIRELLPDVQFVMISASADYATLNDAIEAGFSGFVEKSADLEELVAAVRAAAAGNAHFSAPTLLRLVQRRRLPTPSVDTLSARELEVLQAMAAGRGTSEIASKLFISPNTVRNHVRKVLQKLKAHSKLEAVVIAAKAGFIDFQDGA